MFHGEISKTDYELHMLALKKMLKERFDEKGEENRVLKEWNNYYNTTYELIKTKKCSLFVIRANAETIHVCINRHQNNMFNISIPSYNIAYSKFGLGNISIFKLLEWAVKNNYDFIDMEYGSYEYKRRWSNKIYSFDHHICYNSKWSKRSIWGRLEVLRLRMINLLKDMKVDEYVQSMKRKKNKKQIR